MLEAKQSGNVVEDFTIGNTRIKICDDFCRTRCITTSLTHFYMN